MVLACDVLKFVFLHQFFLNQESFSRRIKSNTNKALTFSYCIKRILTLIHLFVTQNRMHAHVWFEGNFVLLLHGAAILSTAYEKRSIFSVKQFSTKSGKWGKLFYSWDYFGGK